MSDRTAPDLDAPRPIPTPEVRVRDFSPADRPAVLTCLVELQEVERGLDPRLPPGGEIASRYLAQIEADAEALSGRLIVAEGDGRVVGFASVYTLVPFESADDPPGTFALIGDLVVLPEARGSGVGRRLLSAAADVARASGAGELRLDALAANAGADRLYRSVGFEPYIVTYRTFLDTESTESTETTETTEITERSRPPPPRSSSSPEPRRRDSPPPGA